MLLHNVGKLMPDRRLHTRWTTEKQQHVADVVGILLGPPASRIRVASSPLASSAWAANVVANHSTLDCHVVPTLANTPQTGV